MQVLDLAAFAGGQYSSWNDGHNEGVNEHNVYREN